MMLLGTMVAGVLSGCADDSTSAAPQPTVRELHLSLGPQQFSEEDARQTRALLPANYVFYDYAEAQAPIAQIQGYLTSRTSDNRAYVSCLFGHTVNGASQHVWTSRVALEDGNYYLYGYMPKEHVGSGVTIEPRNGDYANGAVLTLTDLDAVTPDDICIIVGAKGYDTTLPNMENGLGKFLYNTEEGDNLCLLIDHLFAGLKIQMRLDETYSQLRKIKLKSLTLTPNHGNETVEKVTARVTIVPNNDGQNPIVPILNGEDVNVGGSVEFLDGAKKVGAHPEPAVLYNGEGKDLTTTYQPFLACFAPSSNKQYVLETHYDVYNMKDELVREDQTAENTLVIQQDMASGQIHTINITVQPTYLYVLSEPDLNNPTFTVD